MEDKKQTNLGLILAALLALFLWAGNRDFNQEVIDAMPREVYDRIEAELGGNPSDGAIVDEYLEHRDYYDSLTINNTTSWN